MGWGICIYCGRADAPLTDEHVVPYSIGGELVLKDASCRKCAAITSRFELKVMRELWGTARVAFDAPTRRRARRRKEVLTMPPGSGLGSDVIPTSEYPAGFVFYTMGIAGVLQGLSDDDDESGIWRMEVIDDDERREKFLAKYPERSLSLIFRHVPSDFARMIIKIGYGQMLTMLSPCDFRPLCVPYILGYLDNVSRIVGMNPERERPVPDRGYILKNFGFGTLDKITLLASVRLLANTQTPTYHVVVGEVNGYGQVQEALRRMGNPSLNPMTGDFPFGLFQEHD